MCRRYCHFGVALALVAFAIPAPLAVAQTQLPSQSGTPSVSPEPSKANAHPLTLIDAISAATQHNLEVRQAALQVALTREQFEEARAGRNPTVGAQVSYTNVSGEIAALVSTQIPGVITAAPGVALPPQIWQFGLTVTYPLYKPETNARVAIAETDLRDAQAKLAVAIQQAVFDTRKAYYGLQKALGAIDAAQRAVEAAKENMRVIEGRLPAGTSTRFDLLQAKVEVAHSEQTLTAAETDVARGQQNLAAVLGQPLTVTAVPTTPLGTPTPPEDLDALLREALRSRPEIAQARVAEEKAQNTIALAAAGLQPSVTVMGGPIIVTSDTARLPVTWIGSVQLTQSIFDGGLTQAKIAEARTKLEQVKMTEEQVKRLIELEVRNAYLSVVDAIKQSDSALAAQAAAREALRFANARFGAGIGSRLEVITALRNQATADNELLLAQYQFNLALAQLDKAIGSRLSL